MPTKIFLVQSYFDGQKHHGKGPYSIITKSGSIREIEKGDILPNRADLAAKVKAGAAELHRSEFLMPGLVEGHSHLFLDGLELDFQKRKDYLSASWDEMTSVGRRSRTAFIGMTFTPRFCINSESITKS